MVRPMHSVRQTGHPTQNYGQHPPRNMSQGVYMRGPRPSQPRNPIHRNSNNQSGTPGHVVGIPNMPGNAGQTPVIFSTHHPNANLNVARPMFLANQHQVSSAVHPSPPQAPIYTVSNQMQQIQYSPQPGAPAQTQHYFSGYPMIAMQPNMIPYASSPHAQMPTFCYPPSQSPHHPSNAPINVNPLNATTNTTMIRAGNEMISQVAYPGHAVSPSNISQNHQQVQQQHQHQEQQPKLKIRPNALLNIVDPHTGKNVAEDIYRSASTPSPAVAPPEKTPRCSVIRITHPNTVQQQPPQSRSKSSSRSGTPFSTCTSSTSGIASTRSSPTSTIIINTSDSPSPPSHGSCSSRSISPMITIQTGHGIMMTKCLTNDMIIPETENISDESELNIDEPVTDNSTEEKCEPPVCSEPVPVEVQSVSEEPQCHPEEETVEELEIKTEEHVTEECKPVEEPVVEPEIQPSPVPVVEEVEVKAEVKPDVKTEVKPEIKTDVKSEPKPEVQPKKVGKSLKKNKKKKKNRNAQKERTSSEESSMCSAAKMAKKENVEAEKITVQSSNVETTVPILPEQQKQLPIFEETPAEIPVIINGEIEPNKSQVKAVVKIEQPEIDTSNSIEPVIEKVEQSIDETPKTSVVEMVSVKVESVEQNEVPAEKVPEIVRNKHSKSTDKIDEVDNVAVRIGCDPINIVITPASKDVREETKVIDSIRGASEINFFVDEVSSNEESPAPTELDAVEEDVENQLVETKEEVTGENEELESKSQEAIEASEVISNEEINTVTYVNSKYPGRRIYNRDVLMMIREDPRCWVRPKLPDMDITRKNSQKPSSRSSLPTPSKNHDHLFPSFSQSSSNTKGIKIRNSFSGKPKPAIKTPQSVIRLSLSLGGDVKLRVSENAWKPTVMNKEKVDEDEAKTQALYKKVRSVLNKLTPEKFETLVQQVKNLDIDTKERMQGVINIIFQKAVDEPTFAVAYALMCKELATIRVASDSAKNKDDNFRALILGCCQAEFVKSSVNEDTRNTKVKEIENCKNAEKKKELQMLLEEDDRRVRRKYLGNIKFFGELFKQGMIRMEIMQGCVSHLLENPDEENLECLCKLLTTIGKMLDVENSLDKYFITLKYLIQKGNKKSKKISSRIRFMIQDVIDLRQSKWVPRRNENNPKTMNQIQKEVETERIISEVAISKTPLMMPRKDDYGGSGDRDRDRDRDRRRGRGGSTSSMDGGWNNVVSNKSKHAPIDRSKLRFNIPTEETFGSAGNFRWGMGATASKNPITPNQFALLDDMSDSDPRRSSMSLSAPRSSRDYNNQRSSDYKSARYENRDSRSDNRNFRSDNRMNFGRSSQDGPRDDFGRNNYSMPASLMPAFKKSTPPMSVSPVNPPNTPVDAPVNATVKTPSVSSEKPRKSDDELKKIIKLLINECHAINDTEDFIANSMNIIKDNFDESSYPLFVEETINIVLERKPIERTSLSHLFAHMINNKVIPLSLVQTEYGKLLEYLDDLVVDIPQIFKCLAEILSGMLETDAHPFDKLKQTLAICKSSEKCDELVGEILSILVKDKSTMWVTDRWIKSGLEWSDLVDLKNKKIDEMVKKFNLGFLCGGLQNNPSVESTTNEINIDQTYQHLLKMMKDSDFDRITSWISTNVGQKSTLPPFVRSLVTAILETSVEPIGDTWRLKEDTFRSMLPLITRYVDANPGLELQCLFAIQAHNYKLKCPQGVLGKIINTLGENSIISDNAYLEWENNDDPAEKEGRGVAIKALTSFFTKLREPDDSSD